jgi:hypothetical protein
MTLHCYFGVGSVLSLGMHTGDYWNTSGCLLSAASRPMEPRSQICLQSSKDTQYMELKSQLNTLAVSAKSRKGHEQMFGPPFLALKHTFFWMIWMTIRSLTSLCPFHHVMDIPMLFRTLGMAAQSMDLMSRIQKKQRMEGWSLLAFELCKVFSCRNSMLPTTRWYPLDPILFRWGESELFDKSRILSSLITQLNDYMKYSLIFVFAWYQNFTKNGFALEKLHPCRCASLTGSINPDIHILDQEKFAFPLMSSLSPFQFLEICWSI